MIPGLKKRNFNLNDVLMYVAIARKHLRLMTLLMSLTFAGALTYYVWAQPVYYAIDLIQLDKLALPLDADKVYRERRIQTISQELNNAHIIERTARRLGVKANIRKIQRDYLFKSRIVANSEGNLTMEIWVFSEKWAQLWTETLVNEYLDYRRERRLKDKETTIKTLTAEMTEVSSKLEEHLGEKFDFSERAGMTRALIELNQIGNVPLQLARLNKRIDELGRLRLNLQDPSLDTIEKLSLLDAADRSAQVTVGTVVGGDSEPSSPKFNLLPTEDGEEEEKRPTPTTPATQSGGIVVVPPLAASTERPWEALERTQRALKAQMADLSRTFLPGHPKMSALQKEIDSLDQKLRFELDGSLKRFDVNFQDLLDQRATLEARLPDYNQIRRKHEKLLQDARLHEAGKLAWNNLFAKMAKTIEALDFAGEKEKVDLTYLGHLQLNDEPVSPNRLKLFIFALVIGTALAVGVPYLIEYLDHTMSNLEEAEDTFQIRGLGIIPKFEGDTPADSTVIPDDAAKRASLLQSFRVIRTNLLAVGGHSKVPQVIMVTSAMPREGKTVVSSNLAISFAQTGGKVLLVDTDLRRGRLHRLFGYRKAPGLSGVLLDQITLEEAIRPTAHENLFVLTAGKHLESGTELLGSPRFSELLGQLRTRFDRIVIDTPPVLGLSETAIMQGMVDGVLFVIWSGHTPIRNIKAAIENLQSNGANFYGFVLNQLDLNAPTNYYQYYYYSYDYYYSTQSIENV